MASRVSVTVPIWFSLISDALAIPRSMARVMIAGLVQKLSSPTSSVLPPSRAVSAIQPSSSSSPRPSSIRCTGNCCGDGREPVDHLRRWSSRSPATLYRPSALAELRGGRVQGDGHALARRACTRRRRWPGPAGQSTSSGSRDLGGEAALVAEPGGQLAAGQLAAQRGVDLGARPDRLGHGRGAERGDHEFLEVQSFGACTPPLSTLKCGTGSDGVTPSGASHCHSGTARGQRPARGPAPSRRRRWRWRRACPCSGCRPGRSSPGRPRPATPRTGPQQTGDLAVHRRRPRQHSPGPRTGPCRRRGAPPPRGTRWTRRRAPRPLAVVPSASRHRDRQRRPSPRVQDLQRGKFGHIEHRHDFVSRLAAAAWLPCRLSVDRLPWHRRHGRVFRAVYQATAPAGLPPGTGRVARCGREIFASGGVALREFGNPARRPGRAGEACAVAVPAPGRRDRCRDQRRSWRVSRRPCACARPAGASLLRARRPGRG